MTYIIDILDQKISLQKRQIEAWFSNYTQRTKPFFYSSVDLRHSGFKLAPVDTNLFPAGFNNLSEEEHQLAIKRAADFFKKYYPQAKNIFILAEDHTRNLYYLENLLYLRQIIEAAGCDVTISNLAISATGTAESFITHSGASLTINPIINKNGTLFSGDKTADIVLVNNDMTSGAPDLLLNCKDTVIPPVGFGWYQRRKTSHFETYDMLIKDFCKQFDLDPWLLSTAFSRCGVVNFMEQKGLECVAKKAEKLLFTIGEKYQHYGIKEQPYVFIKSDRGTYGMGIMTASSGEEILEMGRKLRKKMASIKGGTTNSEVIIQEGIPTADIVKGNPAEPMMYLIGGKATAHIYRTNDAKDHKGNLNAKGMGFVNMKEHVGTSHLNAYSLIAEIASLAASWECYQESYEI